MIITKHGLILPKKDWTFVENENSVELSLRAPQKARYIKLHSIYDERDRFGAKDVAEIRNDKSTLLTAYYTVSEMEETFEYDKSGNRKVYTANYSSLEKTTSNYTYYTNTNLIKTDGEFGYVWDKNGNLIEKSDNYTVTGDTVNIHLTEGNYTKYKYDLLNRLISVELSENGKNEISRLKTVSYTYDHRGYRIKRVGSKGDETQFTFGLSGEILYKVTPKQTEEYIYLFGKHLAKEVLKKGETERTRLYYQTDNLGSTIGITDKDGQKLWDNDYKPFGESTNESGLLEELGIYTGKEIDPETGLYYFNARWYDPTLGRFITEDPIKDGNNWHIYCNNNPINYIDPTGLMYTTHNMSSIPLSKLMGKGKKGNDDDDEEEVPTEEEKLQALVDKVSVIPPLHYPGNWNLPEFGSFDSTGNNLVDYSFQSLSNLGNAAISALNSINSLGGYGLELFGAGIGAVDNFMWDQFGAGLDEAAITFSSAGFQPGILLSSVSNYGRWGKAKFMAKFLSGPSDDIINLTGAKFGHTFTSHGEDATKFLTMRLKNSQKLTQSGQFLDNQKAAKFILDNLNKVKNGTVDLPIPNNLPARVILKDGSYITPTHIRLVPGGSGVKSAFPIYK